MKNDLKELISEIENETKKKDASRLVKIMEEEAGYKAALHDKIIGFGLYHYKYESGREGDAIVTGFSPRKQNITIYITPGFSKYGKELEKLGKHRSSKSCLYINKLADIDEKVLRNIVKDSVGAMKKKYECRSA